MMLIYGWFLPAVSNQIQMKEQQLHSSFSIRF